MPIELKIKAATLAAEARIIRKHEQRLKRHRAKLTELGVKTFHKTINGNDEITYHRMTSMVPANMAGFYAEHGAQMESLCRHRKDVVGVETRKTLLAQAFIKGTPYIVVETPAKQKLKRIHSQKMVEHAYAPDIAKMVRKYGGPGMDNVTAEQVQTWVQATALMKVAA